LTVNVQTVHPISYLQPPSNFYSNMSYGINTEKIGKYAQNKSRLRAILPTPFGQVLTHNIKRGWQRAIGLQSAWQHAA